MRRNRAKSGIRADLGIYVRSSWEANYARYLNWLIDVGEIKGWQYEADTFEFEGIKRGTRFYTPDFKVFLNHSVECEYPIEYHEVKGWMTPKSVTQLKRMAKYHPDIKIILIDQKAYRSIERDVKGFIPNWE